MTVQEFAGVIAYITAATGKPLPVEAVQVYYDLLGDLPLDVLRTAAKRVVLEHKWPTFPTVAELRTAASDMMRGQSSDISAGDAWKLAMRACARCDVESEGSVDRAMAKLPPIVVDAIDTFGFRALYNPGDNIETMRAQFIKIFESLASRQRSHFLLPASVRTDITAIGERHSGQLPAPAARSVSRIGVMDDA